MWCSINLFTHRRCQFLGLQHKGQRQAKERVDSALAKPWSSKVQEPRVWALHYTPSLHSPPQNKIYLLKFNVWSITKMHIFLLYFVNTNVIHLHSFVFTNTCLLVLIALPVAPGNEFITPQTVCVCIVCWDLVSLQIYLEIRFTYFCVWKLNL